MPFSIVIAAVVPALFVILATVVAGRTKTAKAGEFDAETLSFAGSVLNAIFVVVFAFYVVFAWQKGDDIDSAAAAEANALIDLHAQAAAMPAQQAGTMRDLVQRYATEVVDHEWSTLDADRADPAMAELVGTLRATVTGWPAATPVEQSGRDQALADVRDIDDNHRSRVDESTGDDVFTDVLLAGTLLGALLMAVVPLLMGLRARANRVLVMGLLGVVLGLIGYVSIELTHPLHGPFGKSPDAFQAVFDATGRHTPS